MTITPKAEYIRRKSAGESPCYYRDYLNLPNLLSCQNPVSDEHEEMLFIIIHQTYELWFKQIKHDFELILSFFNSPIISDDNFLKINRLLDRGCRIFKILSDQINILDTMTPMEFLEFRDLLVPASGFQSVQFRQIEGILGLPLKGRKYGSEKWLCSRFKEEDLAEIVKYTSVCPMSNLGEEESHPKKKKSLLLLVNDWLERLTLFLKIDSWVDEYKIAVTTMLESDEKIICKNNEFNQFDEELRHLQQTRLSFQSLFDDELFNKLSRKSLSRKATLNALFIYIYRDYPLLNQPFIFLEKLVDLDDIMTTWRTKHASLAHRMIGQKIGTGGTAGTEYLSMAARENKIFSEIRNLSTFLIPKSSVPILSDDVIERLKFH